MERDTFWSIVEAARSSSIDPGDVEEVADALTDLLCRMDEDDVVAFARTLNEVCAQADGPQLRQAAHRQAGVTTPADFDRFRGWLVARGRPIFEATLAAPDRLADLLHPGDPQALLDQDVDGEAMFEAPYDAYGRIVGDEEGYAQAVLAGVPPEQLVSPLPR